MDAVEIFLLWVVGFSVLVYLIVQNLGDNHKPSHENAEKRCGYARLESESFLVELVKAENDQEETKGVGGDGGSEKQGNIDSAGSGFQETRVSETSISEKSDFWEENPTGKDQNFEGLEEEAIFDDWEGIERTELEKIFGKAMIFMGSKTGNADQMDEGLRMELYGLQKFVLEGPCHGSQPMALKVSARAKWNAWQKLGNISREMAMEKYVDILSEAIPDWKSQGGQAIQAAEIGEDLISTVKGKNGIEAETSGNETRLEC